MGGGLLVVLTVGTLAIGVVTGLLAMAVGANSDLARRVTFGWGAVLGPIGIVIVAVVAARRRRRGSSPPLSDSSPALPEAPF